MTGSGEATDHRHRNGRMATATGLPRCGLVLRLDLPWGESIRDEFVRFGVLMCRMQEGQEFEPTLERVGERRTVVNNGLHERKILGGDTGSLHLILMRTRNRCRSHQQRSGARGLGMFDLHLHNE